MAKSRSAEEFLELTNLDAVRAFLGRRGESHRNGYFQYTGLRAYKGMLDSEMLHLSLGCRMNDLAEPFKGDPNKWGRTYVASFAFGKLENVAMWGIYGNPFREAVRIRFGQKELLADVQAVKECRQVVSVVIKGSGGSFRYEPLDCGLDNGIDISVHDVSYWTGASLVWDGNKLTSRKCTDVAAATRNPLMTGYVKNFAWQYEHETRIVITLPRTIARPPDVIAIPFPTAIRNAQITLGPCTTRSLFEQIVGTPVGSDERSYLTNQVMLRFRCDMCKAKDDHKCPLDVY